MTSFTINVTLVSHCNHNFQHIFHSSHAYIPTGYGSKPALILFATAHLHPLRTSTSPHNVFTRSSSSYRSSHSFSDTHRPRSSSVFPRFGNSSSLTVDLHPRRPHTPHIGAIDLCTRLRSNHFQGSYLIKSFYTHL